LDRSRDALRDSIARGRVVVCEVVWAEVSAFFPDSADARDALDTVGLYFEPMSVESALGAGMAWAEYRRSGGSRKRVIGDFLIGAHAIGRADRLLTRDRGFYRSYFSGLEILDPSSPLGD
jgi:predicted nucleic acid-binding protein